MTTKKARRRSRPRRSGSQRKPHAATDTTVIEGGNDGNDPAIQSALDTLLAKSLARDANGRFTHGRVTTGADSKNFLDQLEPVKRDIVNAVRKQLAVDTDDAAPPTLLALIDAYAEAQILRRSTFLQLAKSGGPVTSRGKVRGLLSAWSSFFEKELRASERLGLKRVPREVAASARQWLLDSDDAATSPSAESSSTTSSED